MISKQRLKYIGACFAVAAAVVVCGTVPFARAQSAGATATAQPLDYEFFKTQVEPIFLKQRSADHSRCYACHEKNHHDNKNFRLETLTPGNAFWTEEQSRKNFQAVSQLVFLGNPSKSMLLLKPLDPMAGGSTPKVHSGGSQFESKKDPDWLILEEFAKGKKAVGSSAP
jgi:hypothetical protein